MATSYRASHEACENLAKRFPKHVRLLAFYLPEGKRRSYLSLLAFWALAEQSTTATEVRNLEQLIDRIYACERGQFTHPIERALEQTITRHQIPKELFTEQIRGAVLRRYFQRPRDEVALIDLCQSDLGALCAAVGFVLGLAPDRVIHAAALGTSLKLLNILKDFEKNLAGGINYAPESWYESLKVKQNFSLLAQKNLGIARGGLGCLPPDGSDRFTDKVFRYIELSLASPFSRFLLYPRLIAGT